MLIASIATAAPGDLDARFGDNGIASTPTSDRYEAQGAPLLQADGRIVAAGLLRNASDRVFLERLMPDGAPDTSFGDGGIVHTNIVGPQRQAVTALDGDQILVAGGSESRDKVTVQRYSAAGASLGKVTVDLDGTIARPVGLVAAPGEKALVAVASDTAGHKLTVMRVTKTAIDKSFGTAGVARVSFSAGAVQTADLAVLSSGRIVVAGTVGTPGASTSNTGIAGLTAAGALDTSFGSGGRVTLDAGSGGPDSPASLVAEPDGGFALAGSAGGDGYVARYTSAGALRTAFAGDGVQNGGFAESGATFSPTDIVVDGTNNLLVSGRAKDGATSRWALARLSAGSASPLDQRFGGDGVLELDRCSSATYGATGVSTQARSIFLAGSCGSAGNVAVAKLRSTEPFLSELTLEISPGSSAAGHETTPFAGLDPTAVLDIGTLVDARLRSTRLRSTILESTRLRSTAIADTRLRSTRLRSTLLSEIRLRSTSWEQLLGIDVPLQTLTLEDALTINPDGVGALTLADLDPESTRLRSTSLASLLLGSLTLAELPPPDGGWCEFLAGQEFDCSNGVDTSVSTLFELEISGDELAEYFSEPLSLLDTRLRSTRLRSTPIGEIRLADLNLQFDPLASVKAEEIRSILTCGAACQGTLADQSEADLGEATLADLVDLLPIPSLEDLSLGGALVAMIDPADIPFERTELSRLFSQSEIRGSGLQDYAVGFDVDCDQADGLIALPQLPGDATPAPGATGSVNGGPVQALPGPDKIGPDGAKAYDLEPLCRNRNDIVHVDANLPIEPGSVLGQVSGSVRVLSDHGSAGNASDDTAVDDGRDPGDEFEQARPLVDDAVLAGWISHSRDIDSFSFTASPGQTTVSLSHIPDGADYDLLIFGPDRGPEASRLRSTRLRSTRLRSTTVTDATDEPTDPAITAPDPSQDLPLDTRLRSTRLRSTSINRGSADEAATVFVHPNEAGETFTVQVVGYNGTNDPRPYTIRRSSRAAAPALDCPARPLSSSVSAPFPQAVNPSTQALYLVHPGRMAARYNEAATAAMMADLDALAAETNGVVVPVGDDPAVDTDGAFAAWDSNPCDPELANDALERVNEVVDHVREMGGGLPELRSIVVVGPDDVMPQARIPDLTVIANESEYAADAAIADLDGDGDLDDNAVSGALRSGYLLSDDPYGDFDPSLAGFVPDVALGRLVETPAEVGEQADAFIDAGGVVDPGRAFVTGYDFISDGSRRIFDSLASRVGNNATSRIDETWTAADAAAGANASGAAFLALNAHFDHHRALPAAAFNGTQPDLLDSADVSLAAGSIAFSVGCHSGLNLALSGTSGELPAPDWSQQLSAGSGSLYTANTGFGYGDSDTVAYSEQLMADNAELLAAGQVSAGQALMFAKQRGAADAALVGDDYWQKASMEATFYGLPMYVVGDDGGVGAAAMPPAPEPTTSAAAADGSIDRSSSPLALDLRGSLERVDVGDGSYWQVEGHEPIVVQHRPIQPKVLTDVSSSEGPAVGFLVERYVTTDIENIDPVIASPTVDMTEFTPEPDVDAPFFPAAIAEVSSEATPEGRRDTLALAAGSYRGDRQRLVNEIGGRVLRSSATEGAPAVIRRVDGAVFDDRFTVRVEADGDAAGGNLMYVTDADVAGSGEIEWHRSDLAEVSPGVLATGGRLPSGGQIAEAFVQVYTDDYLVSVSDFKASNYEISRLPAGEPGDPRVEVNGASRNGYFTESPTISVDPGNHEDARFEYSVDGRPWQPYEGPFAGPDPAEGEHLVTVRGDDGSSAATRYAVDTAGPSITVEPSRPATQAGWYGTPIQFNFFCADAVSGVAGCPAPQTLGSEGRDQTISGTATDNAGYESSVSLGGINIDLTDPSVSAEALESPNPQGWHRQPVDVRFRCTDRLSGLASCAGVSLAGGPDSAERDVRIEGEGRDIEVSRTAVDRADRTGAGSLQPPLNIDMTAPTGTITTQSGSVLLGSSQRLNGTAQDALSGPHRVTVTYRNTFSGQIVVREATLSCNGSGTCTWQATLPPFGFWSASAVVTDRAGNTRPTQQSNVLITVN